MRRNLSLRPHTLCSSTGLLRVRGTSSLFLSTHFLGRRSEQNQFQQPPGTILIIIISLESNHSTEASKQPVLSKVDGRLWCFLVCVCLPSFTRAEFPNLKIGDRCQSCFASSIFVHPSTSSFAWKETGNASTTCPEPRHCKPPRYHYVKQRLVQLDFLPKKTTLAPNDFLTS